MKVRKVWNIKALPNHYIVELEDGKLVKFTASPFRKIGDKDLTVYKGHYPGEVKGNLVPDYLYNFYGLEKIIKGGVKMFRINFGSVDDNQNFKWGKIRKIMLEVDDVREALDVDLEDITFETREEADEMLEKIRPYIDASVVEIVETD